MGRTSPKGYGVGDYAALQHLTVAQAAHRLGVCYRTVGGMAERHGLVFQPARALRSRAEYEALQHLSVYEAARRLNVQVGTVRAAAYRFGLSFKAVKDDRPPTAPAPDPAPAPAPTPAPVGMAQAPGWTAERDLAILASLGRYAGLAELARKWDLPLARVQARWHILRAAA